MASERRGGVERRWQSALALRAGFGHKDPNIYVSGLHSVQLDIEQLWTV